MMIDPWGNELSKAGNGEETIEAQLDFGTIENIRNTINVFKDRRADIYGN